MTLPLHYRPNETRHPVRNGTWETFRALLDYYGYAADCCDFCKGALSDFEHEAEWDAARRGFYENGRVTYVWMPPWFPTSVCPECAEYLTPFVYVLVDIGFLRLFTNKFEGVIRDVRCPESNGTKVHWSTPVSACDSSYLSPERLIGDREGDNASQAVEEYQRQPLLGDENSHVSPRCGDQAGAVRQAEDWRPERGITEPEAALFAGGIL